ncbi:MAG: glutaminyl-peptide cyclotransferase [Bacteroidales bacterium]|nr:glutaminyl-peptide cyclotransferase [Bacteroidales bacterium]
MKQLIKLITVSALALACSACSAKVTHYGVKVLKEYPHDVTSYTQGLFFHDGKLYESTGQYGISTFRVVNLADGKPIQKLDFAKKYFVEGSIIFKDKLYILTWTNKLVFVYDAKTLEYKNSFAYPREGWGLTTDGKQLIASDGSNSLFFMDESLKVQKTVKVTMDGRPVKLLNELEYIDGKIWANVYLSDMIVIINPASGVVEATVDCTGLLPRKLRTPDTDVLNGIAKDPVSGKIYLTGKNWPKMYEIELVKVK